MSYRLRTSSTFDEPRIAYLWTSTFLIYTMSRQILKKNQKTSMRTLWRMFVTVGAAFDMMVHTRIHCTPRALYRTRTTFERLRAYDVNFVDIHLFKVFDDDYCVRADFMTKNDLHASVSARDSDLHSACSLACDKAIVVLRGKSQKDRFT